MTISRDELIARISDQYWFHSIDFGDGIISPGLAKIEFLREVADIYFKEDPKGRSVLDIGCWDGFNTFEARRRGASRVLATDHFVWSDASFGDRRSFDLARAHLAPDVEVLDIDIPDLSVEKLGRFDIVLFLGVLYHMRHPFHVLEQIAPLALSTLIVETHIDALEDERPVMVFYPGNELNGDSTNWWGPNVPCVIAMLRDLGFSEVSFTQHPAFETRGIFHAKR